MAVPFDQRPDLIWFDGKLVPTAECKINVLTHGLHYASAVFEGERAYGGEIFKSPSIPSASSVRRRSWISKSPTASPRSTPPSGSCSKRTIRRKPMCGRSPGAAREQLGVSAQNNTIHLAIATWEWPSYFDPAQRLKGIRLDLAEYRRPDPQTAPCARQGVGPLRDLHDLQASRRAARLCRRHDARLAGPRRRMHRREYLLHQGRQDPHADRRLLPCPASPARPRSRWRAGAISR